jgi:protein gp37
MGSKSEIQWTDSTWNPITGCSKVSPGCANCYAEELSLRRGWSQQPWTPEHAAENVVLHPERLDMPLHWRAPRRVFVNSMSDLFHELVPSAFINEVWRMMFNTPRHTYQVLTKRPERLRAWTQGKAAAAGWPIDEIWPAHIWIGTSVENQHWADVRVPILLDTPAAVRFLSCEPLLGPVSLDRWLGLLPGNEWDCLCADISPVDRPCICCEGRYELGQRSGLSWVIVGGESGPHYRPMHLDWARTLRNQCLAGGISFFFKQVGGRTPKAGGRELDGRTWDEFPGGEAV